MKFCPTCGTQLPDDAGFCTNCGTRFESQPQPQQQAPNYGYQAPYGQQQAPYGQQAPRAPKPPKKSIIDKIKSMDKKKLIMLGGAVLAAIIAIVVALSLLTGPKALARKYVNAYLKGNAKQFVNCMPSYEFDDKEDKEDLIEYYEEQFEDRDAEYKNIQIQKIVVKNASKDVREDLKDDIEDWEDYYDNFKPKKLNVNSLKYVSVFVTWKDEDGNPCSRVFNFYMAKYSGKWVIFE